MVFDNIFNFTNKGAEIFSVNRTGTKSKPGEDIDFEDADENTYEDTHEDHKSLFSSGIHGASSRAKVVQEQSPEARNILRFIGTFIETTQGAASEQRKYAQDPESVSKMASAGMEKSSETVKNDSDLQKDDDLKTRPKKSDFTEPPTAPKAKADDPPKST
jgi:hypothetical protein